MMTTMRYKHVIALAGWLTSVTLGAAQTPNLNQQAVDTLTKDVATVVFANIKQPKAQEIYQKLVDCGDGCDAQTIIRTVGGWDAVGVKMEELSTLKNTARFVSLTPGEANAAIRNQLASFYARYKDDRNYGQPLNPAVRTQILAKIDRMLPPAEPQVAPAAEAQQGVATQANVDTAAGDESGVDADAVRMSQLERQAKEEQQNRVWMMIVSAIAGLIVGAAVVYLLMVRGLKNEINRLLDENSRLSRSVDTAQRNKPTNGPRQPQNAPREPQPDYKQKADAYDILLAELGADPLAEIRQLKQQATRPTSTQTMRSGQLSVDESANVIQPREPVPPVQQATPPVPAQPVAPVGGSVFYCPPPDPNGVFDAAQQSPSLSPESAYRFSINPDRPDVASFRFEAEPGRLARFITYRNYMIEPACESENSYSSAHTRVVMRRDGEAVLENGSWRVKTKALIRYE
ncbi:hypothetical protein GCM10027341_40020 [Spirosoma knui]